LIRLFLTIGLSVIFISLSAQRKLIFINDPDGFVNVRDGQGLDRAVIDSIKTGEWLYCEQDGTPWLKVHRKGTPATGEFDGYIHKSRVRLFENISDNEKKNIFNEAFEKQKGLGNRLKITYQKREEISKSDQLEWDKGFDSKYNLLLPNFSSYFCQTKDDETMKLLLETIWANNGSASEQQYYTPSECYPCEPDLVLDLISNFTNSEERKYFCESIALGLGDLFHQTPTDPKLLKFKKQLEFAKKYK
jgi:hypothetical protein